MTARLRCRPLRCRALGCLALGGLLAVALAGCGGSGGASGHDRATPSRAAGGWFPACPSGTGPAHADHTLPDIRLPCADGDSTVRLDRAFGRPTVINLWASWCGPCRAELPAIDRYATAHPDVLVFTVDTRDTRTAGESFARDAKVRLPTLRDPQQRLLHAVGRSALPVTLLVTADGRLAETYNGRSLTVDRLDRLVGKWLT